MNHPTGPVAVVVARTDPTPDCRASLARFAEEVGPLGEVVLVDSSGAGLTDLGADVRVIRRPSGRLAPELWRDGLLATEAPLVGFSTARMIPRPGWLGLLVERLRSSGAAGVGGPIEPGTDLTRIDRAVALLRYSSYFPPLPDPARVDPPGDNALYRRDRLMEVVPSWIDGFWEVEVHRAMRDRGENLDFSPEAVVTYLGGSGLETMVRQRWAHGFRYGAGRSSGLGPVARLARIATCPMVPPLLALRAMSRLKTRGMGLLPWIPSIPSLAALASTWAIGEAIGTWRGDPHSTPDQSPSGSVDRDQPMESVTQPSRRAG